MELTHETVTCMFPKRNIKLFIENSFKMFDMNSQKVFF
jgi:hypothetical protein